MDELKLKGMEEKRIEPIHKLEAHNQAMNESLIGVGRTEARRVTHPQAAQMRVGAAIPIVPPLSDHATEIRGLKEALENTRASFDRFAQDVQERISNLEMKVGS